MSGFSEHKVLLCLDKELYRAFIKLQADKDLGRSYAGLLPYVEGLYRLGYISQEVYERHAKKYSEPLGKKEEEHESLKQKQEREFLQSKDTVFKGMIAQFALHEKDPKWLLKCSREAEKFQNRLDSARILLSMIPYPTSDKATVE